MTINYNGRDYRVIEGYRLHNYLYGRYVLADVDGGEEYFVENMRKADDWKLVKGGRKEYEDNKHYTTMSAWSPLDVEEVAPKFDEYSFESYDELKAWLDSRKDDERKAYYYGFMENFDGTLYTVADIASDMDASWFDEGTTVEIYEEAKA